MTNRRGILLLAGAQTVVWAGLLYIFPALLLRWEQYYGWSKAELTAGITLALFLSAFAAPVAGRLIDRGKGPLMMTVSTIVGGLSLVGLSQVTTLFQFYIVWGLIGVMLAGCLYEPCFALITRARGAEAKQSIILVTLIAGFASAITFPAAHALAETSDWRTAVLVFAALVVFLGAPLMWFGGNALESGRVASHEDSTVQKNRHRAFLLSPVFWLLGIGFARVAVVHGTTLHHLLPILDDRNISPGMAVMAASFIGPMQVTGRLAMMAMQRHVSHHGIAITCFLAIGLSTILLISSGITPALLAAFIVVFGGGYGIVSIIRPVIARDLLGEEQFGAKSGALALLYLVGAASSPYLGSLVWNAGGYDLVLPCLISLTVAGLGLYLVGNRIARQRPS